MPADMHLPTQINNHFVIYTSVGDKEISIKEDETGSKIQTMFKQDVR